MHGPLLVHCSCTQSHQLQPDFWLRRARKLCRVRRFTYYGVSWPTSTCLNGMPACTVYTTRLYGTSQTTLPVKPIDKISGTTSTSAKEPAILYRVIGCPTSHYRCQVPMIHCCNTGSCLLRMGRPGAPANPALGSAAPTLVNTALALYHDLPLPLASLLRPRPPRCETGC